MIRFTTTILKFNQQGEKTGWTYISVPAEIAGKLLPGNKKSFRVKGKLDDHPISGVALLPMGDGDFILALNAQLRKDIGKGMGARLTVQLAVDEKPYQLNASFMECMKDDPAAEQFFFTLPMGHQHYFSKWIGSAKSSSTRDKRIAQAITYLSLKLGYSEMIRAIRKEKDEWGLL